MEKREIQIIRMRSYFIDATVQIIEEEGIEHVTIRRVADIAGYNSATIYNYFKEVSHLIFFAAMKYLKRYVEALPKFIEVGENAFERFLLVWECFCKYSFEEPKIYHAIFTSDLGGETPKKLIDEYYDTFPTELVNLPLELKSMFLESSLSKRGIIALEECIVSGHIKEQHAEDINEFCILIWQGMHIMMLNNRRSYTVDEATNVTMKYIRDIVLNAQHFQFKTPSILKD
ncbi:TetR/AcrR family transcriptional regulator [Texcoconibacillus texcoconensis]|uniref:AcrR family transcriptional regulator n=1 Tax=Texcoconibacillus texcoconensis TaxID=1095777 RepID=A0A840QQT4_9BACI|nr:TetR/AcrR family transcriptional regulator [Texcoconibacillus texcoconensis]MBB5173734.1 AcrR family transcriptional regulator [Texcoconibacillus texcoconensis]